MKTLDYGIQHVEVENDNIESTIVKFGDGMTRISGAGWQKGIWGIQFARVNDWPEPFYVDATNRDVSTLNNIPDIEKVYLVFDNVRSVDALVDQLKDIRVRMVEDNEDS